MTAPERVQSHGPDWSDSLPGEPPSCVCGFNGTPEECAAWRSADGAPDAAGIEAALAAGLADHHLSSGGRNLGAYRTEWTCECGGTLITDGHVGPNLREANIAHVAAALLPVVTQAQAEALRGAADEAWRRSAEARSDALGQGLGSWRTVTRWLRARADESGA